MSIVRLSSFSEALPVPGTACRPITSLSKDCLVTVNSTSPRQLRGTTMQECLQDPREDPLHAPNQTLSVSLATGFQAHP